MLSNPTTQAAAAPMGPAVEGQAVMLRAKKIAVSQ